MSWRRGFLVCFLGISWGCGSADFPSFSGQSTQSGDVQTAPITVRVDFTPAAKALGKVADSTQFTVALRDPITSQTLVAPITFDRSPPGTLQQTVTVQAPRGPVTLSVSFLQDNLLVGVTRTNINTALNTDFAIQAQELFRPLAGANVSAEQRRARLASHPAGFITAWAGLTPAGGPQTTEVFARRYSSPEFQALGDEFQVNIDPVANAAVRVDVAADALGNFMLVWDGFNASSSTQDIFGRRYASDGQPQAAPFVINSGLTGEQSRPRLAMDPSGQAVVVWQSTNSGVTSVSGRHFNAQGNPVSGDVLVADPASNPIVSMINSGGNLLGWMVSYSEEGNTFLQAFSPAWAALGKVDGNGGGSEHWEFQPRSFVIPHILEKSGTVANDQFAFDTSVFVTYTAGVGVNERAAVNYYTFDPVLGIVPRTVGGQLFSPLGLDNQSQSFFPSGTAFAGGAIYTYTTIQQGLRKQIMAFQNLDGQFAPRQSLVIQSPTVMFGFAHVADREEPVNVQGMVVTSNANPFDVSVFGFEPQALQEAP